METSPISASHNVLALCRTNAAAYDHRMQRHLPNAARHLRGKTASRPPTMVDDELGSSVASRLQASIDDLNRTLIGAVAEIAEIEVTEEKSQAELNTFYLMWAGTAFELSCGVNLMLREPFRRSQVR